MEPTMLVKEAMTPEVRWFSPDTPIQEVARVMRDEGIGCVPIGENDRLVGMITDRDITCRAVAAGEPLDRLKCRGVMSSGIFYCYDDQTLDEALGQMQERQVHHLPVLNRQKRMIGIISLGDIALKAESSILAPLAKIAARDAERHPELPDVFGNVCDKLRAACVWKKAACRPKFIVLRRVFRRARSDRGILPRHATDLGAKSPAVLTYAGARSTLQTPSSSGRTRTGP